MLQFIEFGCSVSLVAVIMLLSGVKGGELYIFLMNFGEEVDETMEDYLDL